MAYSKNEAADLLIKHNHRRKLVSRYSKLYEEDGQGVYSWQREFHNAGKEAMERCLIAANRVGKTDCAAAELACHATGMYPPWWQGRRFKGAVRAWVGSESAEASRDIVQLALLGPEGEHGTGWIPANRIHKVKYRQAGVSEVADLIEVKHKSGGISRLQFKQYEQKRLKWQGTTQHIVWFDEEPNNDIYTEGLTRILDVGGIVYLTFTPLRGASDVVRHFLEPPPGSSIYLKNVGWDEAPHLSEDDKQKLLASYPEHERDTRASGKPMLGSGAVFPLREEYISTEPFKIPDHFYRINGVDFGMDHPAAGAFVAWDKDSDTIYLYDGYKRSGETPLYHAEMLKKHGTWIPVAWPHDGFIRDKGDATAVKDQYRKHGARMLREHAHYPDERGNGREPGLIEMYERMRTNKFKVFSTCKEFFEEMRLYHRKDGAVVAKNDDLISACRYAVMMKRYAQVQLSTVSRAPRPQPMISSVSWR